MHIDTYCPKTTSEIMDQKAIEHLPSQGEPFSKKLFRWSWVVLGLVAFLQVFVFPTKENVIAVACVLFAWTITSSIFLQEKILSVFPLSSFLIIGFTATQFYFPLIFTFLEGKPVIYNLDLPLQVFFHSTAALLILAIAHYLYRFLPVQIQRGNNSILNKFGFFKAPSELQLWMIGIIGLGANVYVFFFFPDISNKVAGDPSDKAILALFPFAYAPYFIPFAALYGIDKPLSKKTVPLLIGYTVMLFIVCMARNSRGAFMIGFTSVGFSYLLGLLTRLIKMPVISYRSVFLTIAGFWLLTGPMADLGTAMVIVRAQRDDLPKSELINLTWIAFQNKAAIKLRRLQDSDYQGDWDERYLNNIFTARFANLKFNDASLAQAAKIGDNNPALRKYSIDYVWGALPTPLLNKINPSVDKEMVYSLSFGDYIFSLTGAGTGVYGGFRTGHFAGTGMAAFGLWYLAILGAGMVPVFVLLDKLVIKKMVPNVSGSIGRHPRLYFNVCGLLVLTSIFQFLPSESVVVPITFLIRGWAQMNVLYLAIFLVTRVISNLILRPAVPQNRFLSKRFPETSSF